jgi:phosphate transport system substrate-binding protein
VKWNDPLLKSSNPGVDLPDLAIIPVNRSDGSGTTYIFTDFLSSVSPDWKSKVGTGKSVQWPASGSVGGKGNEGVAGAVKQTPGAVGYVELAYALENQLTQAQLQNKGGKWAICTVSGVRAAAATKPDVNATSFSIVDATGPESWPISGYTWAMVYENPSDKDRAKVTKDVLSWAVTKGQSIAGTLNYVPLPENVQASATKTLSQIKL